MHVYGKISLVAAKFAKPLPVVLCGMHAGLFSSHLKACLQTIVHTRATNWLLQAEALISVCMYMAKGPLAAARFAILHAFYIA